MVHNYGTGRLYNPPPFGTNNFSPRWSMGHDTSDTFGLSIRKGFIRETAMKQENKNETTPWKNQSSHVRFYPQQEYVVRNQDFSPREIRTVLPPIANGSHQSINIDSLVNVDRLGRSLHQHSHRHVELVRQYLEAKDKNCSGFIPLESVNDVLKQFRYPEEEELRTDILKKYLVGESDWVAYGPLVNFLQQTRELYSIKQGSQFGQSNRVLPNVKRRSSSSDITSKPNHVVPTGVDYLSVSLDHVHGLGLRAAFADRRDGVLIAEMDRQFKKSSTDPKELVNALKERLSTFADISKGTVSSYKVKALMQKLKFPFNNALMDKLIDRLNPSETGEIRCNEFTEFLCRSKVDYLPNHQIAHDKAILATMKNKDPFDRSRDSLDLSTSYSKQNNHKYYQTADNPAETSVSGV